MRQKVSQKKFKPVLKIKIASFAIILFSSLTSAQTNTCFGDGGDSLCTAPSADDWSYSLCDVGGTFSERQRIWCEMAGGVFTNPGCTVSATYEESSLVSDATQFTNTLHNRTDCAMQDSGWGANSNNNLCGGHLSPLYDQGVLTLDVRVMESPNCGERFVATRDRQLTCPRYARLEIIDGKWACIKGQDFNECGVGNPILPLSGKKIDAHTDAIVFGLSLRRHYNSERWFVPYNIANTQPISEGQFGDHWRTSFDYRMYAVDSAHTSFVITKPNGVPHYFNNNLKEVLQASGKVATLSLTDGIHWFDTGSVRVGFINQIAKFYQPYGSAKFELKYTGIDFTDPQYAVLPSGGLSTSVLPDQLLKVVVNSVGLKVYEFFYDAAARVVKVQGHQDRELATYDYTEIGNLNSVVSNQGHSKTYHYESDVLKVGITGWTNAEGVRSRSWTYDQVGRAITSESGDSKEKVIVDFTEQDNGQATSMVTNALGKSTTYQFEVINGHRKLKTIDGHASANCVAASKEYTYFPDGTIETKTDWQGRVTRYERDDLGRTTKMTEAENTPVQRIIVTEYHPTFNRPIKIIEPNRTTHYEYYESGPNAGRIKNTRIESTTTLVGQ